MAEVRVAVDLFEAQGVKIVRSGGGTRQILPGEVRRDDEELLMRAGEPSFRIRTALTVTCDDDVPDDLAAAVDRAVDRLARVRKDGTEVDLARVELVGAEWDELAVEGVVGPSVRDGAIDLQLDTDGRGFTHAMIDTMAAVFVEELRKQSTDCEITVAPLGVRGQFP